MSKITELALEDVRCFQNETLDIRPLTLLIGENSTGKSTALGCLQVLENFFNDKRNSIDFNFEPYHMGAFADIVRKSNPKKDCFNLRIKFNPDFGKPFTCLLSLRERETGSEPIIESARYIFDDGEIMLVKQDKDGGMNILIITEHGQNKFIVECNSGIFDMYIDLSYIESHLFLLRHKTEKKTEAEENFLLFAQTKLQEELHQTPYHGSFYTNNMRSFAPIRAEPQRTYNPVKEREDPWGSETPMVLRNLKNRNKDKWKELHKQLVEFGKASGLFLDIAVRELGPAINDPFQLQIKVKSKSPMVNLVDVGYGIGQILPILVSIFNAPDDSMFLLQQPEVHLHPRGQAELPSLLVGMHKNSNHSFLVETHSDYIIDRTRILVRNGKIQPKDVSILYFEPTKIGNAVKVYNMKIDEMGNLINVPKNYRNFFTKETDTLLGFDEE